MQRGVDAVETVRVELGITQFKQHLGHSMDPQLVADYFKSSLFRKEFRIENDKIKCSRTM